MQLNTILLVLSSTLGTTALASQCTQFPYKDLTFLSAYPPAVMFCSSKYPIPVPTCSTTTTVTSILTSLTTITEASATTTFTATTGMPATTIITSTITPAPTVETSTVTITTISTSFYQNNQKRAAIDSAKCSSAFGVMTKMLPNIVQTACSCIETTPPCTTSTSTKITTVTATSTGTAFIVSSTTITVPNTQIITVSTSITLVPTTVTSTVTSTMTQIATSSVIAAPRCDPLAAGNSNYNVGGCSDCFCNLDSDGIHAYCVDDGGSINTPCNTDADCPAHEFCDSSIGNHCDSGLSCTSTYIAPGATKRDLFGREFGKRLGAMRPRSINTDGPNWKAMLAASKNGKDGTTN